MTASAKKMADRAAALQNACVRLELDLRLLKHEVRDACRGHRHGRGHTDHAAGGGDEDSANEPQSEQGALLP